MTATNSWSWQPTEACAPSVSPATGSRHWRRRARRSSCGGSSTTRSVLMGRSGIRRRPPGKPPGHRPGRHREANVLDGPTWGAGHKLNNHVGVLFGHQKASFCLEQKCPCCIVVKGERTVGHTNSPLQ